MNRLLGLVIVFFFATPVLTGCADDSEVGMDPMPTATSEAGTLSYIDYDAFSADPGKYAATKNVLYFTTGWCAECRRTDTAFRQNPDLIPSDVTLIRVDYDVYSNLRELYDVTIQHTFVWVDEDGNLLKKWTAATPEALAEKLQE
ncbi:MAG: thioredoxin domain-containing protein [Actinomycetaceae bacterium]|nr:thioredoxin domain-containing protein [Actinomycetaceae bacterium]